MSGFSDEVWKAQADRDAMLNTRRAEAMSEQVHEAPEGAFGGAVVLHADTALEHAWLQAVVRVFRVFQAKQADYGPGNIAAAGEHGVALRANDKVQRLLTLTRADAGASRVSEALADTWVDLADYGVIGLLVHEGSWPSVEAAAETVVRECQECVQLKLAVRALMEKYAANERDDWQIP